MLLKLASALWSVLWSYIVAYCCRLWYVEPVVQLRKYSPYLVAEVTVESDNLREALSSGFKQVTATAHAAVKSNLLAFIKCSNTAGSWLYIW